MKIIDSNALVVLIVGLIDPNLLKNHKRTSLYDEDDFLELLNVVGDLGQVVILPNVWTEVDNLLNSFSGHYKYSYITNIAALIASTTEKYVPSATVTDGYEFYDLGLTDALILGEAKNGQLLITSDSMLSDYAVANGIQVYDLVKAKNEKLK
ncbi:hypothetical protein [Persicitalea jodogahamensis]|uniref:PIN domain-containing protein n=1 Tax=Persicitalea jodogahamensis TaxID=402147 RepID=A0A8J3D459_9BACT|nr:hypothetical protein [Persicitalea jodogahamensis]GHB72112.1 hypothetical protein GCM10007390_27700 [Persicitalea jodogahamensis]